MMTIAKTDRFTPLSKSLKFEILSYLIPRINLVVVAQFSKHFHLIVLEMFNGEFSSPIVRLQIRNRVRLVWRVQFENFINVSRQVKAKGEKVRMNSIVKGFFQNPCSRLRELVLPYAHMGYKDDILDLIATNCSALTSLTCRFQPKITDKGVHNLLSKCTQIVAFDFTGCNLTADAFFAMKDRAVTEVCVSSGMLFNKETFNASWLSNTQSLSLFKLIDESLYDLNRPTLMQWLNNFFQNCSSLTQVDFSDFEDGLNDESVSALMQHSGSLTSLNLEKQSEITDRGVNVIALHGRKLQLLNLSHLNNITHESILQIMQSCSHLQRLDIQSLGSLDHVELFSRIFDQSDGLPFFMNRGTIHFGRMGCRDDILHLISQITRKFPELKLCM